MCGPGGVVGGLRFDGYRAVLISEFWVNKATALGFRASYCRGYQLSVNW